MTLLTIAIPTYNRAENLRLLLATLKLELSELVALVQVMVSDNASTDHTPAVLDEARATWPGLIARRNATNIGADGNFCAMLDVVDTPYFWLLGDDDLPKAGVLPRLVRLLTEEKPSLVYMQSEWVGRIEGPHQGRTVSDLHFLRLDRIEMVRKVNVWFTFISGTIVHRETLLQGLGRHSLRRYEGTNLVQLGWIYPVIEAGDRFVFISDPCVLATKDNTGGYGLLTVFGANFPRIAREAFGPHSALASILISQTIQFYLPGLVWTSRSADAQRFAPESPWPALRKELGSNPGYWLILFPIGRFPRLLAQVVRTAWRVVTAVRRRAEAWLTGRRHRTLP